MAHIAGRASTNVLHIDRKHGVHARREQSEKALQGRGLACGTLIEGSISSQGGSNLGNTLGVLLAAILAVIRAVMLAMI